MYKLRLGKSVDAWSDTYYDLIGEAKFLGCAIFLLVMLKLRFLAFLNVRRNPKIILYYAQFL